MELEHASDDARGVTALRPDLDGAGTMLFLGLTTLSFLGGLFGWLLDVQIAGTGPVAIYAIAWGILTVGAGAWLYLSFSRAPSVTWRDPLSWIFAATLANVLIFAACQW